MTATVEKHRAVVHATSFDGDPECEFAKSCRKARSAGRITSCPCEVEAVDVCLSCARYKKDCDGLFIFWQDE